jgi:hypothetical protein
MIPRLIGKGECYGQAKPRHQAGSAPQDQQAKGQEEVSEQFVGADGRYDRDARRLADNSHGNTVTRDEDYADLEHDDVARATYPDPKARHLNRDSEILAAKRELEDIRQGQRQTADEPFTAVEQPRTKKK